MAGACIYLTRKKNNMQAFDKRISIGGGQWNIVKMKDRLIVLNTNDLRNGHVSKYPGLAKWLDQIEELEMKTRYEIVTELIEMMFPAE